MDFMDKFLSLNSTIVEPSTMLYNSDLIEDAVIFIDEFDATKETVLKNIIQNGLRDRVDYGSFGFEEQKMDLFAFNEYTDCVNIFTDAKDVSGMRKAPTVSDRRFV